MHTTAGTADNTHADSRRKIATILQVLAAAGKPIGSSQIAAELANRGINLKQRMVRNYLIDMDAAGLTVNLGRPGRRLTPRGQEELDSSMVMGKVGFMSAKVDELAYSMSFDLMHRHGTVILNISRLASQHFRAAQLLIQRVLAAGLGMGEYVTVGLPGETIGGYAVPEGTMAIGTLCSVTLNGVLRAAGIPTTPRFGGLLELQNRNPIRFSQIIYYEGTTIDPVEIFIKGRMTRVVQALETGNGVIGASFREIPAAARPAAERIIDKMQSIGLGGVQILGRPGCSVLEIPVPAGRCGLVVSAGLNPLAAVEESGIETENHALASLLEFDRLIPAQDMGRFTPPAAPPPTRRPPSPGIGLNQLPRSLE